MFLLCDLEKWASVKVVEVEREENDWAEVQHGGSKSYWCKSAQCNNNSGTRIEVDCIT